MDQGSLILMRRLGYLVTGFVVVGVCMTYDNPKPEKGLGSMDFPSALTLSLVGVTAGGLIRQIGRPFLVLLAGGLGGVVSGGLGFLLMAGYMAVRGNDAIYLERCVAFGLGLLPGLVVYFVLAISNEPSPPPDEQSPAGGHEPPDPSVAPAASDDEILSPPRPQPPPPPAEPKPDPCPRCGFAYQYDGSECGHCDYPHPDRRGKPNGKRKKGWF